MAGLQSCQPADLTRLLVRPGGRTPATAPRPLGRLGKTLTLRLQGRREHLGAIGWALSFVAAGNKHPGLTLPCGAGVISSTVPAEGPMLARAAGLGRFARMLDQRVNRICLSPHDMAVCQRVFDRVCADEQLDPLSREAELLASMVVGIFRNSHTNERQLLEAVRSRRQEAAAAAASVRNSPWRVV